ncbi:MAG: molybdopterin dinucleotide binding domain-containing protein [Alphaproteobacteria bacterium]
MRALGAYTDEDVAPLHAAAARIPSEGRGPFAMAFLQLGAEKPHLQPLAPVILFETLGPMLPDGAAGAAALWGAAQLCATSNADAVRRAGFAGDGPDLGDALFDAILTNRSGITFSVDEYDETWRRMATPDGRIRLSVDELLPELRALRDEHPERTDAAFPFVLAAGERRSSTANTIFRDPAWRKKEGAGALRVSKADAERLGLSDGTRVRLTTKRGSVETPIEITDTLQAGHLTLPNGLGLAYPDDGDGTAVHGVAPNELTASEDRDWLAGTPWHKHVAARLDVLG